MKKSFKNLFLSLASLSVLPTAMIAANCGGGVKPEEPEKPANNDIQMQTSLGLSIANKATKAENIPVSEAVAELKQADNLDKLVKVLNKFGVNINTEETPDGANYKVDPATHGHADEGEIHLVISQTTTNRISVFTFEITGFKEVKTLEAYNLGSYIVKSQASTELSLLEIKQKLLSAQEKSFDDLKNALIEVLGQDGIKLNETQENKNLEFALDANKIDVLSDSNQIIFNDVKIYDANDKGKVLETTNYTLSK
ncbi:hypothetical protein FJO69_02705 [[Mycoplasma] falconis]|uniref:Variable surface lipoprotein n=1 Tax=[Mycoplasma] falconis TaxID=92403 RepID=A0A501X8R7_9BACT|nr:hypothetical protein [[Mycoplasma] falconis]TPE56931.1 hypothetical protein FJO69_02705 [[Mycoplasma] falconis]